MSERKRSSDRRTRPPPDTFVRVALDLPHERLNPSVVPVIRQIEAWLHEQEVEELGNFLVRAAELLDELGGLGYSRVDHWEVDPGGWLPLPEATHAGRYEPVQHLIRALQSPAWLTLSEARSFAVRLTSTDGARADARVFHVHRERGHSITVDLWGTPSAKEVRQLVDRLRNRFTPLRVTVRR